MTVLTHFELQVDPSRLAEALAVLDRILDDTRAFAGNQGVTVAQDEADPAHVLVIAEWDAAEHHDAYLAWRAGEGAVPELPGLLAEEPGGARFTVTSIR
ncbi:antibiotic biosynthesis monooxygenase [Patulibacter sp. SYSU D01012]|uniref:putative quinol monooxygenase n=1 Tax=Patulibacter sp. SYSU D01012 TaxID=2817381 RepID=UPI001B312034|nr:antibiotic biosynthesis monooxygenase [Patulibacter sp. SYSU D01012]